MSGLHGKRKYYLPTVIHHMVCQHQMGVEVWPASAEVYFRDERDVDPVNTQVRFDAVVINAPTERVTWQVISINGGAGVGSIDASGLYVAPPKGSHPHGLTDIVVATVADDPLRKAYGRVTLIGFGPEPPPQPKLEIYPREVYLYYPQGADNSYMDVNNTMQTFRALILNSSSDRVEWRKNGALIGGWEEPWYQYRILGSGGYQRVILSARLKNDPIVRDEAIVHQINYNWPGV